MCALVGRVPNREPRMPSAVRTEKAEDLAIVNFERDAFVGDARAEPFGQMLNNERGIRFRAARV